VRRGGGKRIGAVCEVGASTWRRFCEGRVGYPGEDTNPSRREMTSDTVRGKSQSITAKHTKVLLGGVILTVNFLT